MSNLNEIRQYNQQVQAYQKKASELLAQKDYQQKELVKLCNELTEMTGQQVTPENLDTVYEAFMTQFNQTLKTGKEIIERAKAEEQSLASSTVSKPAESAQNMASSVNTGAFTGMPSGIPPMNNSGIFGNGFPSYDAHGQGGQL